MYYIILYIQEKLRLGKNTKVLDTTDFTFNKKWQSEIIQEIAFVGCRDNDKIKYIYLKFIDLDYDNKDFLELCGLFNTFLHDLRHKSFDYLKFDCLYTKEQIEWARELFDYINTNNTDSIDIDDLEELQVSLARGFTNYDEWKL